MAGVDMLKAGGNAVDAAICANAMLGLVEPMSNGIGGDLFAIIWIESEKKLYGLNASGRSPFDWGLADALDLGLDSIPRDSPLAWSIPGAVSGWDLLRERFGRTMLSAMLEPAIHYAEEGFPVSPIIASGWGFDAGKYPTLAKTYMPNGRAPGFGEIFKNPELARSLSAIANDGPAAFYEGEIAEQIVAYAQEHGGKHTMKDFADHRANWLDPVSSSYRGYDVWELPPNGQGIAVLQMLNILETFDIGALTPNSAEHLHLFVEAKKLAFEDRAVYYADPDFADVPVEQLLSKAYAQDRAKLINPQRANNEVQYGDPSLDSDTVYLTAADSEGNMISFIQSIYEAWGSRIAPNDVGFAIQNRGQSFSLDPGHRNKLERHKRPFHTIIPGFITKDGAPVCSFGVMGGDFQPQGHSQVVMNAIDFGMSAQQAGDQPRLGHDGSSTPTGSRMEDGGRLIFERGFDDSVRQALAEKGHRIDRGVSALGGYQSIWREENPRRYFGGSDPRKDGSAIGY
jgi:gamma-glutamyltranspeptidase/glutathione hydrolase